MSIHHAIRPITPLLATAALATLPLNASAHEESTGHKSAEHSHAAAAGTKAPQGVDKILTPDQIDLSSGKALLDANDQYHVRILRIQIPANKELQPHGPKEGYFFVNVISGTLQLGFGNTYDASKLQTLPPGSIFTHPAGQLHYARTGDEPVVLQITAINPHGGKHSHHHGKKHSPAGGHEHGHDKSNQ